MTISSSSIKHKLRLFLIRLFDYDNRELEGIPFYICVYMPICIEFGAFQNSKRRHMQTFVIQRQQQQ